MGEENTETDVACASEVVSNLLEKPVESVNDDMEQESLTNKENDENVGIEETIEEKTCNQIEDSADKEDSNKKLSMEGNEQTVVVPQEDAEPTIVDKDTAEPKDGETKKVVEVENQKNDAVKQDKEPKEVALGGENNDIVEQNNKPREVVLLEVSKQDDESRFKLEEDNEVKRLDASGSISKAVAGDEAPKKEMLGGINEDAKAAGVDGEMKTTRDVNEEEIKDINEVKEGQENEGDVNKEKMEVEQEPKVDKPDNESIGIEINSEENGLDVEKGSETEQVEGKPKGSSKEEDKQDNDNGSKKRKRKKNAVDKTKDEESQKTPAISLSTRPVRERKSVERLVASVEKEVFREIFVEKVI